MSSQYSAEDTVAGDARDRGGARKGRVAENSDSFQAGMVGLTTRETTIEAAERRHDRRQKDDYAGLPCASSSSTASSRTRLWISTPMIVRGMARSITTTPHSASRGRSTARVTRVVGGAVTVIS